ncbi:thiamine pyrophosphate-dependent dehydrogenase E1 component subunit alpha [Nocardioides cavernae]|uniref:Thiamine pyrophosphate-dependent dehydrogenase E1 component subunit alpha n=1 Tax=Nocardioides cavernae TaxID=1921566 RepID=A0ABR8N8M3_9ACTN|nr:thiamine pyrophosphate-dependent dehydrogenase E1 component subunit alpha [Nocardioides cavernae]MBD3924220.1 thiamine pyrophosphate-dependent dehydrogenase E1 component subunit alpha [Nocardioides cavernae]MBM7510841.1 TPP-dependent pyruvate/acetoin dehydrogenase alpha subunit [Nocardioides cavernae]
MSSSTSPEQHLELYRSMVLTRGVETAIERSHRAGRIAGSFHSSLGQESAAAGVCLALRPSDAVTSNHRGHGHALAKGVTADAVIAELYKKTHGTSGGRGASMHLHDRSVGFYGETAIVGGGVPWAAGVGWAKRRRGTDDIAVTFGGDGAAANGVVPETLRMAKFWESPCLFVCENNGWAHSMPVERIFGPPGSIAAMARGMGIRSEFVDGRDVTAVFEVATELIAHARTGQPAFLEIAVYRVRAHSINDADYLYRSKTDGQDWLDENDPIAASRQQLMAEMPERVEEVEREVAEIVRLAVERAEAGVHPEPADAFTTVYATEGLEWNGYAEVR